MRREYGRRQSPAEAEGWSLRSGPSRREKKEESLWIWR